MKITTAKAALGAALTTAALALTACTGGGLSPTPTASETTSTPTMTAAPTPTSTSVAAPTSQDQALKDGFEAARKYGALMEELSQAKSTDTSRLDGIAKGPALDFAKQFVTAAAKTDTKYSGSTTVTLKDGYASELTVGTEKFEFGAVDLSVCEDTSKVVGVEADGSPAKKPDQARVIYDYWAEYDPATKSWFVTKMTQDAVIAC